MPWSISPHLPEHTPQLRRIYLESRRKAFTWLNPATLALPDFDKAIAGEEVLVALHQHKPIGFIAWWPPDNFIHSLYIDPAFVRQGVGLCLLQAGLARMGRPATLKCVQANQAALAFYQSLGWAIKGSGCSTEVAYHLLTLD